MIGKCFREYSIKERRKWRVLYRLEFEPGALSDMQKQHEEFDEIIKIGRLYGYG